MAEDTSQTHFTAQDRRLLTVLETKLDRALIDISNLGSNYAEKIVVAALADRVAKLEDNNKWIARTIGGIIISAIMAGILIIKV